MYDKKIPNILIYSSCSFQHEFFSSFAKKRPKILVEEAIPWTAAWQVSLSSTVSWSLLKFMSIELVMLSKHLILRHPLLLLPLIFPSIRVLPNESALHIRWLKYWSFSFNISPSNEHPGLISLLSKGLSRVFSSTKVQKQQFKRIKSHGQRSLVGYSQ